MGSKPHLNQVFWSDYLCQDSLTHYAFIMHRKAKIYLDIGLSVMHFKKATTV